MGFTRQQYEDRIRQRLGDFGVLQLISEEQIPLALEDAFTVVSKDEPREAFIDIAGDGATYSFDLTVGGSSEWEPRFSRIIELESPLGQRPRELLDVREADVIDGTTLQLDETTPAAGDTLRVRFTTSWPFPDDTAATDELTASWGQAVASLAAANVARAKAIEYARRQSNTVLGDTIQQDPDPLFEAARQLEKLYRDTVLGRRDSAGAGSSSTIALAVSDIDILQENSLFHRREQLSG